MQRHKLLSLIRGGEETGEWAGAHHSVSSERLYHRSIQDTPVSRQLASHPRRNTTPRWITASRPRGVERRRRCVPCTAEASQHTCGATRRQEFCSRRQGFL